MSPLLASDAVEFFVARARTCQPSVAINEQNVEVIRQICSRLDRMPLAIELAASRLKVLTIGHLNRA